MTRNSNKNWKDLFGSKNPRRRKKLGSTIFSAVLALILVGFLSVAAIFCPGKIYDSQNTFQGHGSHGLLPIFLCQW